MEQINKTLEKIENKFDKRQTHTWEGLTSYFIEFFSEYINYTYNSSCKLYEKPLNFINFNDEINFKTPFGIKSKIQEKDFNEIKQEINNDKRFLIFALSFFIGNMSHQNMLIYDKKLNQVELFDPEGGRIQWIIKKEKDQEIKEFYRQQYIQYFVAINKFLEKIGLTNYKFFKPISFMRSGLQNLEIIMCSKEKFKINSWGFCVVWSFMYTEVRLSHPNIPRDKIVKEIFDIYRTDIKKMKKDSNFHEFRICKVVRGYVSFLLKLESEKSFRERWGIFIRKNYDYIIFKSLNFIILLVRIYFVSKSILQLFNINILGKLNSFIPKIKNSLNDFKNKKEIIEKLLKKRKKNI